MDLGLILKEQLDAAVHQKRTERVDDPVESFDEGNAGGDENRAHDEGAQDSPEQYLVLVDRRHLEETEDEKEDKQVVDAQREFDNISGDELQRRRTAVPEENDDRKNCGQGDPGRAPGQCFAEFYGVSATVEYTQVEDQHSE